MLLFGYFFILPVKSAESDLQCVFNVMAAKEKKKFFSKKRYLSKIHRLKIKSIPRKMLILYPYANQKSFINHDLFQLSFEWIDEKLNIVLAAKEDYSISTLANVSLSTLLDTDQKNEKITYRLFIPIQMTDSKGYKLYIFGLEIGPCHNKKNKELYF